MTILSVVLREIATRGMYGNKNFHYHENKMPMGVSSRATNGYNGYSNGIRNNDMGMGMTCSI